MAHARLSQFLSCRSALARSRRARRRVLAVASGGGHWVQLRRLAPAFDGHDVAYVTTIASCRSQAVGARLYLVNDANRTRKLALLRLGLKLLCIIAYERPDVVVSTGAAPGYLSLRLGKLFGARTVWVDSIANADELSLCGRRVSRCADLWLTQWAHLAAPAGPAFVGSVL